MNKNNKTITIMKVLLTCVMLFGNTNKAYAIRVTWNEIINEFKNNISEINAVVTSDSTSMNITGLNENSNYTLDFEYENNEITLIPRNKNDLTEEEMSDFAFADIIIIGNLVETIADLYGVDTDEIDEEMIPEYGISYQTTSYEYTSPDGSVTSSGDYIDAFSINLEMLEAAIDEKNSIIAPTPIESTTTSTTTKTTTTVRKNTEEPEGNPQTGTFEIILAWIMGIVAMGGSILYFKQIKNNEA